MEDVLISIGLSRIESKIYLSLLEKGEQRASEILSSAGLNSGRIYEVLNNLQTKGFISIIDKEGVKYFSPSPPKILKDLLNERSVQLEKQKKEIENLLPSLTEKYSKINSDMKVEVFTGKTGMKSAYEILFSESSKDKNLYVLGLSKQLNYSKWIPLFMETYTYPTRKRLKLKILKLMDKDAKEVNLFKEDNSEIRYLKLPILTSFEILGDVVIIQILYGETTHIIIRNKQVAEDYREQFKIFWKIAKK